MRKIKILFTLGCWFFVSSVRSQVGPVIIAGNVTDPRVMLINPAALAFYQKPTVVSVYNHFYTGLANDRLQSGSLGAALPLGAAGSLGLSGNYFSTSLANYQELAANFARSFLENKLALGARLGFLGHSYNKDKFYRFDMGDPLFSNRDAKHTLDVSAGLLANPSENIFVGLTFDHLNRPNLSLSGDPDGKVPFRTGLGAMYRLPFGRPQLGLEYEAGKFYFSAGADKPLLNDRAVMRSTITAERLGLGAALLFGAVRVDYDFQWALTDLNQTTNGFHHITLSYNFKPIFSPEPPPDFSIEIIPQLDDGRTTSLEVFQCDTLKFVVKTRQAPRFNARIHFSIDNPPPGVSAVFLPTSVMPDQAAELQLQFASASPVGICPLVIYGRSGDLVKTVYDTVWVKPPPEPKINVTSAIDTVTVTTTIVFETREESPLLAHVFFEEGSDKISADRYNLQPQAEFRNGQTDSPPEQHRNVLNILAWRLRQNPSAKIILTGCRDNDGLELNDHLLSYNRARRLKRHLVDICGVDSMQIAIEARGLPKNPSTGKDPLGREENRRVEIMPLPGEALAPLMKQNQNVLISDSSCAFVFDRGMAEEAATKRWRLTIANETGQTLRTFASNGAPPEGLLWDWRDNSGTRVPFSEAFDYHLEVENECNKPAVLPAKTFFVKHRRKESRIVERTQLFIFQFDSDRLDVQAPEMGEKLDRIAERFHANPGAAILIKGYTDTIGTDKHNKRLSSNRAKTIRAALRARGIPAEAMTDVGFGAEHPMMSNSSPEGRMMNRRVEVDLIFPANSKR